MTRPSTVRHALLDRSLEGLPLFRLSDTADDHAISYSTQQGGRWRVLASPDDRLPGTFDQDVYLELMHRFYEAGAPADGVLSFTLHAFLRSMGRQADGRTYTQLRASLARLEHTVLQSEGSYFDATAAALVDASFTLLSSVMIERRRVSERNQLALFPALVAPEPGEARVAIAPIIRQNLSAHHVVIADLHKYRSLPSPVARRLYRLIELARIDCNTTWTVRFDQLCGQLPLSQRYPSHIQRVLQPAHAMLQASGVIQSARIRQYQECWFVDYTLAEMSSTAQ